MDEPKRTDEMNRANPNPQPQPGSDGAPRPRRGRRPGRPNPPPREFTEAGGSPAPGLTLKRVLRGHTGVINRIDWSPDGRWLASPSNDRTIRIWDVESGKSVAVLKGHGDDVLCVTWSPEGDALASGSADKTVRVWEAGAWEPSAVLEGFEGEVYSVAWSPDGRRLAAGSKDRTIRIWRADTWDAEGVLRRHEDEVNGVVWSPDGRWLASASDDKTVRAWDPDSERQMLHLSGHTDRVYCVAWVPVAHRRPLLISGGSDNTIRIFDPQMGQALRVLEGHTRYVKSLSCSADGTLLASKSHDQTVRLWDTETWVTLAVLPEISPAIGTTGLAFNPRLPRLATLGESATVVRVWDVDREALVGGQPATKAVHYTTAKLVLVGDSGVGKTGLGWRLAHGEFRDHPSTHGQQFWVVEELKTRRKDGTECEAVLWDLAGQPVYRPVHAIFLDDVDLSLVLFDPTNRAEPLKGAQFWLEQLAGKGKLPPSVLVGGRVDRGAAALSREELEQFCQRYGISGGYVGTSAKSREGLEQLLETIKAQIPWEQMTSTVTTVTFKRVKGYVLSLKEKPDRRGVLVRPGELRAQLEATDKAWEFTDAEMMTAVRHLATHGYVAVLRGSSGERFILLTPELLVDLASSIVLQADKHPRDHGALSETELLKGGYGLPELATLEQPEQQILLDAAVARFLSHNICFRETLGADALLIFPGLIKQKRPLFDEVKATEDVSYVARGRVENVYPALVVLLGYTQTFTRVNQWQNQAQYQMGADEICGFRLIEEREGEIELVLYYSAAMPAYGRAAFQGLFEQFLYQRDVQVTRFPPVVCPNGHRQKRATVVERLREGKEFVFCDECGERAALPEIDKPQALGASVSRSVRREEALAHLRSAYETYLVHVKGFRRDRTPPRCYVSHAPEQDAWAAQLARDLSTAGAFVVEDNALIQETDFVILVGSHAYRRDWDASAGPLAADAELVRARLRQARASWPTVIPLVVEGESVASLPRELHSLVFGDFSDDTRHPVSLFDLVLTLYAIQLDHPAFDPLRKSLLSQWNQSFRTREAERGLESEAGRQVFISYAWGGESEKVADELDDAFRSRGVTIVRDKRDLRFKGSIKEFMEGVGRGRCVILIISDAYLKSPSCMFELVQVAKHDDFAGRVFPVVLGDARIYEPVESLGYVEYWEQKFGELDAAMKGVSAANLQGFREQIDLYVEIRALLPRLTDVLKDMNALTPEMHRGSGFEELFESVMARLGE